MKLTMKLTMREPASMTTDTWSRRVTVEYENLCLKGQIVSRTTFKLIYGIRAILNEKYIFTISKTHVFEGQRL